MLAAHNIKLHPTYLIVNYRAPFLGKYYKIHTAVKSKYSTLKQSPKHKKLVFYP